MKRRARTAPKTAKTAVSQRRRARLHAVLEQKRRERRRALALIKQLEAEIRTLELAERLVNGARLDESPVEPPIIDGVSGRYVMPGSALAQALTVLQRVGRPMHIDALIAAITADTARQVNKDSLVGALARVVRARTHVYRAGPNTFGLLNWRRRRP